MRRKEGLGGGGEGGGGEGGGGEGGGEGVETGGKDPKSQPLNGRKMTSVSEKQYFIHISVFEIKI